MTLMLIVSGFGNLGTVLAENEDNSDIYLSNEYKRPMVIDDPANFDYVKYWINNYKYGTNTDLASNAEASIITEMSGYNISLYFVNPLNSDKVQPDTMYKEYFKELKKVNTSSDVEVLNDNVLKRLVEELPALAFVISPDFKTPIYTRTGWTYVSPEYLKSKYPMIRECINNKPDSNNKEKGRNWLNYYGSHNFYSNKNNFDEGYDFHNIVVTAPDNLSKYNLPENLTSKTKEELNDYYKDGHFIFREGSILYIEVKPLTGAIVNALDLTDTSDYYTFENIPGMNSVNGPNDEITTNTILKYNHEAKYVSNNKLKFSEKKYKEGTPNVVLGSSEFLTTKNELSKIDKNSEEYKEYEKYLKDLALKNEIFIKNTLSFLNSDKWSATPLTYEIGNVDTKIETIKYKTIEKEDPTLAKDERKVEVMGKNGEKLTVTTYEVDEKTGELKNPKTEEKITKAIDKVVLVGTKVKTRADIIDGEISKGNVHAEKEIVPWGGEYNLTDNIIGITDDMGLTDKIDVTEPKIDTKKSGEYTGKVKLIFDDGSELIINVPVEVLPANPDKYTPNRKDLTVKIGEEPKAEDAITNKNKLPDGTKYEWKEKPDTKEPGIKDAIVVVTYPDGSTGEAPIKVNVIDPKTDAEKYPANKPTKTEVEDKNNLTPDEKTKVAEEVKKVNPEAKDIDVKDNGDTTITYPDESTNTLPGEDTVVEKAKEDIPLTPLTPSEEIEKPVEPKKDYSREPKVDPIYEGDEKITGKGEPRSDIEIRLPNRKTVYGRTDREGYFEIKIGIKLYEDKKIYVTQIEDGKEPSKEVVETVKRSYRHKDNRVKNNTTKTTSTSDVVGVLNSVQDKLITKDHYSYIVGYPDGGFKPANTITRAEVATIFARLSKDQSVSSNVTFKDVKANDWFNKAVKIGVSQEFINGFGDGTFKPNKPITRAEFASVISNYANKSKATNAFGDVDGWAAGAIDTAYANGWMQGNAGKFRPNDPLTRAEAVTVINRMLNRQADKAFIANAINNHAARAYNDINAGQWFFYDVYAASWGHNYTIENSVEKWTGLNGKAFTIR